MPFRTVVRTRRFLYRVVFPLISFYYWALYSYRMWKLGVSEAYIRLAFSELAQLDIGEWVDLPEPHFGVTFKAWGNEVHVRHYETPHEEGNRPIYECVIKESPDRRVYVDEWRDEQHGVILEHGFNHVTNWWEVYRSGRHIRSTKFVTYLKILYGEGTNVPNAKTVLHEQSGPVRPENETV